MSKKPKRAKIHTLHDLPPPYEVMKGAPKAYPPLFPKDPTTSYQWQTIETSIACEKRLRRLGLSGKEFALRMDCLIAGQVVITRDRADFKFIDTVTAMPTTKFSAVWRRLEALRK